MKLPYHKILGTSTNTIVLLHGFMCDSRVFESLIDRLKNHFKIILIDLPGYGHSADMTQYLSLSEIAQKVIEVIDRCEVTQAHILGHSMGGYIALELLSRHSSRIKSLILLNSHPLTDNDEKKINREKSIDFISKHGAKQYIKVTFGGLFSKGYAQTNPDEVNKWIGYATDCSDTTLINSSRAMINRINHLDTLANNQNKIYSYWGVQDELITQDLIESIIKSSPNLIYELDSESGHMSMIENTDGVYQFIINHLVS